MDCLRKRSMPGVPTDSNLSRHLQSCLNLPPRYNTRIRRKYGVTDDEVSELIDLLVANAVVVDGTLDVSGSVPDDPDDEIVLACAVEGQADLIVTGDQHLLVLGAFGDIPIVTVRYLLEQLAAND